jgi:preprotein translocase subunit SecG
METLVLVIHVLAALALIGLILLQHGKGADVGAAFGSGASGSLFGASGSANFLSRTTAVIAVVFFVTSLGLTYFSTRKTEHKGVMGTQPAAPAQSLPAQIPPTAPAGQTAPAPAVPAAPAAAGEPGSKVQDVPK